MLIHQIYVKKGFLNGELEARIKTDQPEGFVILGKKHKVCQLQNHYIISNKHIYNCMKELTNFNF